MIYDKLFDWQKKIIDKYSQRKNFGIFLDMGLGKTPISLAFAEANNCNKIIVITINSKAIETINDKWSWPDWISKLDNQYQIIDKHNLKQKFDNKYQALVINYDYLYERNSKRSNEIRKEIEQFIKSCKNEKVALILDESHKIKSSKSTQNKCVNKIKKQLKLYNCDLYTYLLTGTPFTKGYIDLLEQLKLLGCTISKAEFVNNYCIIGHVGGLYDWQQPIVGYKNIDSLYNLIHRFALTVKSEELIDLPDTMFIDYMTEYSSDFKFFTQEKIKGKDILEKLKKQKINMDLSKYNTDTKVNNPFYRNISFPDLEWFADTSSNFWMRCRQLSIGFQGNAEESKWFNKDRLIYLKKLLENEVDNYVLFYNFTPELIELYQMCEQLGYNIDVYCGEIKSLEYYDRYRNSTDAEKLVNKGNIIIANFASGSTGMNWQEYNKCIIFSLPLYKDYAQALKRVHRIGQKNKVIYYVFYQNNWLDLGMKRALDQACDYSEKMFESDLKLKDVVQ